MHRSARRIAGLTLAILSAGAGLPAASASAQPATPKQDSAIVLTGATSAEGIARGTGTTFYAGDLFAGDIYRGDVKTKTAALFIDAPAGRMAVGMKADVAHKLLFVAGGFTGVYFALYATGNGKASKSPAFFDWFDYHKLA